MEAVVRKFGMRDKIGYAMGDFGCNLSFSLISSFLLVYYTQYMGLTAAQFGIIIFILKCWDAVNDPIMGTIIDTKRISSKSKFKPWIRIGSFGLVVSGAIVFLPFPNAAVPLKIVICLLSYLIWDVCYTLVNVPYGAMNSSISANPDERTSLSVWRSIGAAVGGLMVTLLPLICYDDNDNLLGGRFFWIALVMGIMAFAAYTALLKMTTERVIVPVTTEKVNYIKAVKGFLTNRPLLGLGLASFAQIVFFSSTIITNSLVFQIYFHSAKLITFGTIASYLPMAVGLIFSGKLSKKYGKKAAAGYPLIISIIACIIMLMVPVGSNAPILWIVFLMIVNLGGGIFTFVVWAMVSDCIDYQQYKTGLREEGSVYAIYSLFRKLAQGVGSSLIAFALAKVGYDETLGAYQTAETALGIKNLSIVLVLIGAVIMLLSLLFIYNIGKKESEEMCKALNLDGNEVDLRVAIENRND